MNTTIEVVYSNDDLTIVPRFDIDDENLFIGFGDNLPFIKQAAEWYLRTHYKIDPEILGLTYDNWEIV